MSKTYKDMSFRFKRIKEELDKKRASKGKRDKQSRGEKLQAKQELREYKLQ